MPIKKRGKAIHDFQTNDDIKLFLLTTKSSNTGITLTAASEIVFLEPCINKSKYIQAIGRINRLGQTEKSLNVYTLITEHSVEPFIDSKVGTLNWLEKIKLI
jgi:SNF2 family DNA or RNA helicase